MSTDDNRRETPANVAATTPNNGDKLDRTLAEIAEICARLAWREQAEERRAASRTDARPPAPLAVVLPFRR